MELTKEEAVKLLGDMVSKIADDKFDPVIAEMKAQLKALTDPLETKVHDRADQGILAIRNIGGGGDGYVTTPDGSIFNMKTPNTPWVKLSPEVDAWAKAFQQLVGSRGTIVSKDLVESDGSQGGFLVPDDFVASIVMYTPPDSVMWPRATIWPMGVEKLGMPRLAQTAYDDDSESNIDHFAGVVFSWIEETDQKPETDPVFEFLELIVHEFAGYTEISNTLIEDSPINVMNFLTNLYGNAYMYYTDRVFFRGSGVGQPLGIVIDPRITIINRQTAGAVVFRDLLNMDTAMPSVFDSGAVWFANKAVLNSLRGQVDDNGQLVLREYYSDVAGGMVSMLLGYQVIKADGRTYPLGTKGDLILCNPTHYYIGDRRRYTIDTSAHAQFRRNKLAVRLSGRLDGQPAQSKAFVVLDDVAVTS